MKQLFSVSQYTVFLWILLAVFVLLFIIKRIDTVFSDKEVRQDGL